MLYNTILKDKKGSMIGKYWIKVKPKTWAGTKLCICMSDIATLFRPQNSFNCVDCRSFPFLGFFSLPVCRIFFSRYTMGLGSSSSLGLQYNSGFIFTTSAVTSLGFHLGHH